MMISIFILCLLLSCEASTSQDLSISVASYNVEALFDTVDDGDEFFEELYQEDYLTRISLIQDVLKTDELASCDIIFLQEIESEKVLIDLLDLGLRKRGFTYYGITNSDSPIQVGFISKSKVSNLNTHKTTHRDILSLTLSKEHKYFNFIVLHAKSKIGEDTNLVRKELAEHINVLVNKDAYARTIILGDFNAELCSDSSDIISIGVEEEVISNGSIPVTRYYNKISNRTFYDPFSDYSYPLKCDGSYYYSDRWYMLDHIMFNKAVTSSLKNYKAEILNFDFIKDEYGKPYGFNLAKKEGYSDHFPIKLKLYY